ncbi:hypothetical protein EVAR_72019_1 [Eumeta japonica]|uniref:Uncharacterized protein n=1 Tax=Eumeta variegata TaxID=151549 RepID=A0A4C1SSI3_EUMVA|nr:hypothetical protein EVAR_72019_1 [Eumeta japonica]
MDQGLSLWPPVRKLSEITSFLVSRSYLTAFRFITPVVRRERRQMSLLSNYVVREKFAANGFGARGARPIAVPTIPLADK